MQNINGVNLRTQKSNNNNLSINYVINVIKFDKPKRKTLKLYYTHLFSSCIRSTNKDFFRGGQRLCVVMHVQRKHGSKNVI